VIYGRPPSQEQVATRDMTDRKEVDGEGIHVGDCYVWAENVWRESRRDAAGVNEI